MYQRGLPRLVSRHRRASEHQLSFRSQQGGIVSRVVAPLTVGMPIYNGERYVADAIESVLSQTYGDFEFIISDNASTDATEELCRGYASRDDRIVYSRLDKNVGAAANFNRVFLMSQSPYFKFAAHDDLCEGRFLETCMNAFEDAPDDVVLCFPRTVKIDSEDNRLGEIEDSLDLRDGTPQRRFRSFLTRYNLSNPYYGVVRASAYGSTRMHQSFIAADMVLLGELALRGRFWQLPEPMFLRRFHSGMSGEAASTLAELAQHYDTSHRGEPVLYRSRLFREFARAIAAAPLSAHQRALCRLHLLTSWLPRHGVEIAGELTGRYTATRTGSGKRRD